MFLGEMSGVEGKEEGKEQEKLRMLLFLPKWDSVFSVFLLS